MEDHCKRLRACHRDRVLEVIGIPAEVTTRGAVYVKA